MPLMYNGEMNTYCTFYIVRHGETDWNVQGRLQGHQNSKLTENGIKQVEELRGKLKDIHFDALYSSDLLRTKKTAEILNVERKLVHNTTELIRERSFGPHEGKISSAYRREMRKLLNKFETLTHLSKQKFKFPGVESDAEIVSRYLLFLRETAVAYPGKKVLVVSHGGVMKTLLTHLGFGSYEEMRDAVIQNASYIQLESDGVDFIINNTVGIHKFPE